MRTGRALIGWSALSVVGILGGICSSLALYREGLVADATGTTGDGTMLLVAFAASLVAALLGFVRTVVLFLRAGQSADAL